MGKKLIFLLLVIGCGDPNVDDVGSPLFIYMDLNQQNEIYRFDYPSGRSNLYTYVRYNTDPITRVFWSSPDSFTIIHQGFPITSPIINYSTYSYQNGGGKQFIYIDPTMINDTLDIVGCVDETFEIIEFIVQ